MLRYHNDEQGFARLLEKIKTDYGFDFTQYREACFKRRIDRRLRVHRLANYLQYIRFLNQNPAEVEALLNATTVNVTEFFRDPDAWAVVKNNVIPALFEGQKKRHSRAINIWSAGASWGNEAYTLAILFKEMSVHSCRSFCIKIYGTDIDEVSIKQAHQGCYSPHSVRNVTPEILKRYFDFDGKKYCIHDALKQLTQFNHRDLVLEKPLKHMDFIVCRNVLIYFSRELQLKILEKFYQALDPGGFLMLGKTESLWGPMQHYFPVYDSRQRIYQKV